MAGLKSILEGYGLRDTAAVSTIIGGKPFKSDNLFLLSLEFEGSVWSEASICVLKFRCSILEKLELHKDFASAKIGVTLKVQAGYASTTDTIFDGFVHSIGVEIEGNYTMLVISGMDGKIWMMSGKQTEMKKDMQKFSDIVRSATGNYSSKFLGGTSIKIDEEPKLTSPIYQRNESDFEFLCRISRLTGSLFYVSDGKLFFTSPSANKSVKLEIEPCIELLSVKFSANLFGAVKEVEVKSFNEKDAAKPNVSKVSISKTIGSGETASSVSNNVSGLISRVINDAETPEQANFFAKAEIMRRSFFVTCHVQTYFFPDAKLGTGAKCKSFGNPIDDTYLITGIRHSYNGEKNEFFTFLTLQSDGFTPKSLF
jgi:phage protein D